MIRSMTVENFRGFERFELHDLGRVNLLVGTNNSGKTSILEAVDLLTANGDMNVLHRIHFRRSEDFEYRDEQTARRKRLVDTRRLFRGHALEIGNSFRISGITDGLPISMTAEVIHVALSSRKPENGELLIEREIKTLPTRGIVFDWANNGARAEADFQYSGLSLESLRYPLDDSSDKKRFATSRFIAATSMTPDELIGFFSRIQLRPEEDLVCDALRLIDPGIQRIAVQFDPVIRNSGMGLRGGFLILHRDFPEPIPIGSLGEGIWRLLALALSLSQSANGILLIDDIDSGLHYTVMEQMWKLVTETAKRLNIQVFATTHSRDCYESLAAVCRDSETDSHEVTIQRIEARKKRSVAYSEQEIIQAAEHGTEVR